MDGTYWVALLWLMAMCFSCLIGGCLCGNKAGQKDGYIQALQDMKHGKNPAYVLVEQADGTTKWESNKEKGK